MKRMLIEVSMLVRSKLERITFADELNCLNILKRFPNGCCKPSALIFLYYLRHYFQVDYSVLYLLANAEITKDVSHAWARVDGFHIDLTGDQFGKDRVIVSEENPWLNIYCDPEEFPFEKEDDSFWEPYEKDLIRICNYIKDEQ